MHLFYSICGEDGLECVEEDEEFLKTTTFYEDCEVKDTGDPVEKDFLEGVTDNKCSENRRCDNVNMSDDDRPFVGGDPSGDCTCPVSRTSRSIPTFQNRFKRQTGEIYTVGGNPVCRVQRPRRGRRRAVCDMLVIVRSTRYERSSKIAALNDQKFNIEQDPAICGLYAENCI